MSVVALAAGLGIGPAFARAGTRYVDGISDQSLPEWGGSFSDSSFAREFATSWVGQIKLARYVLQWNAMTEPSAGPNAAGDYHERFEAWLSDVRSLGLAPVVAVTSYTDAYPSSAAEYQSQLEQLLADAGNRIEYVEAWNEPNDQGDETAVRAGEIANWAQGVCERDGCQVIAGDLEDGASVTEYERRYVSALRFSPRIWGLHPYHSVKSHSDSSVLGFEAALPNHGAGAQIWFTEVGAYYCIHGHVRGEAQQESDASYLLNTLIPATAPTHVFYYGWMAGDDAEASCTASAGGDTELYRASGQPRGAASVIFRAGIDGALVFGANLSEGLLALSSTAS